MRRLDGSNHGSVTYVRGQNKRVSHNEQNYYRCTNNYSKGLIACNNSIKFRRDVAEATIKDAIRRQLFDRAEIAQFNTAIRAHLLTSGKDAPAEAQLLRKRDREIEREKRNILASIKAGIWTATTGGELRKLEIEQHDLQARLERIEASAARRSVTSARLDQADDVIADLEPWNRRRSTSRAATWPALLGGAVHVYSCPGDNVVVELQGHLLGLLDVVDARGRVRSRATVCIGAALQLGHRLGVAFLNLHSRRMASGLVMME